MKKGFRILRKIVLWLLLIVLICIVSAAIFRNVILASFIPSIVSSQTGNRVNIEFDKIHLGWDGGLYMTQPRLTFDSTFLDDSGTMEVEELAFDTIHLYGFSYRQAIFDNIFLADSLRVSGPTVKVKEQQANITESKESDFDPQRMLEMITGNTGSDPGIMVRIGRILVDYGKLDLTELGMESTAEKEIDFNIYIEKFSTLPEDNRAPGRIFFTNNIIFEIANIDKVTVSGYDIDLGSLLFSVQENKLSIKGIDLFPHVLSDSIDQVALAAKRIDFNGLNIDEISGKEEIHLSSVRISEGYLTTNTNRVKKSGREAHNSFFSNFSDNFRQFKLDTLGIHAFNLEFMEYLSDSMTWVANLNLELYGVLIDSAMMDDLYRELEFNDFILTAGPLGYNLPEQGLSILADSLYHNSSRHEKTALFNTDITSTDRISGNDNIRVNIGEISVYGITEEPIPYPQRMHLSVFIKDISGFIRPSSQIAGSKQKKTDPKSIFDWIQLDTVSIENTSLDIDGNSISVGQLGILNNKLVSKDIRFVSTPHMGYNTSRLGGLSLDGISLEGIINDRKLIAGTLSLDQLRSEGEFIIPVKSTSSSDEASLPFDQIEFSGIRINNCSFDSRISFSEESYSLKTQADMSFGRIVISGPKLDLEEIGRIKGRIHLTNTTASLLYHNIKADDLLIDLDPGGISISGLNAGWDGASKNPGFIIHNLEVPELNVAGLDLYALLSGEEFRFDELEYNKVSFTDISVELELDPDSSHKMVSIDALSLVHDNPHRQGRNFMDDITFSFGKASFEEASSNTYFRIGNGKYRINGNELSLNNIKGGNIDKDVNAQNKKSGWSYSSKEIVVQGLYIRNTVPTKLSMNKLVLSNADIVVSSKLKARSSTRFELELESYRRFGKLMTRLSIDTTLLSEVRVEYRTFSDTSSHTFLADSIGLTINNIDIDTNVFANDNYDVVRNMSIDLKGRTRVTKDSLYTIRSGIINYDFANDIISIDSLEVIPRYKESDFFEKAKFQTDRMSLFGQRVEAYDFRLDELLENEHLHFGRIDVKGLHLVMMRDKTYPRKPDDFKPMPQDMLRNASQKFTIDSVRIFDSYMKYGEYVEKSSVPGTVFFDQFNLNMYNLSSDLPMPDPTTALKVDLNARVMGEAHFELAIVFPLLGNTSDFWFEATSEELDLTLLNPLTEAVLGLSITEGRGNIQKSFITGNSEHTRGTLMFTYTKLKLNLYNRKKAENNKGMFAGITRFLINDLMIHKNNPKFGKAPRVGQVYFERDPEKAILNYVWKSLLSGMLSSVGINTKEQRQERRDMKKISDPSP